MKPAGMWRILVAGVLCGALCPFGIAAATTNNLPDSLSLVDAFRLTLAANPDIRVARLDADREAVRVDGERGRFDATVFAEGSQGKARDPLAQVPVGQIDRDEAGLALGVRKRWVTGTDVTVGSQLDYAADNGVSNALDPEYVSRVSVTVSQDLLRNFGPEVNRAPIQIQRNNAEISKEALRSEVMRKLFGVERAYWDMYFALADVRVRETQMARARELVRIAEARVEVGDAPPIETARAQASAASQAVAILEARNRAAKLRHSLLQTMGVLSEEHVAQKFTLADGPPEESAPVALADALAVARRERPEMRQTERAIHSARLRERMARNGRLPMLRVYGDAGVQGLDDDSADVVPPDGDYYDWEVGLRMEVPLPNRTARAEADASRLAHEAARERATAVWQTITREVADAVADVSTAAERMIRAGEARELAQRLLRAEEKSFSLGRTESFNVLDAQAALADAERDRIAAQTDYATALANLYRVQGDLLKVKGVALSDSLAR